MTRVVVITVLLLITAPSLVVGQTLITAAANVRLRSAPDTSSAVVTMLPLGTELERTEAAPHGGWVPVRTARGDVGWIHETLTLPVSDSTYPRVIRELIVSRLDREADGFKAAAELLTFVESSLERDWSAEHEAWLELQRLRALYAALQTIPFNRSRWDDDLRSWVERRSSDIGYNEPGGHWLINREAILERHAMHRTAAAADELAWFMVRNGLPGECEGYLVCYLERSDRLEGEYLRRHPQGRYVEEALARLRGILESYVSGQGPSDFFDPQSECVALTEVLGSLEAAVRASNAPGRSPVISDLRSMLRLCSE